MELLKRFLGYLLLILLMSAVSVYGFLWLRERHQRDADAFSLVHDRTVMILETDDYLQLSSSIRHHNNIWSEFLEYEMMDFLDSLLITVDSLTRSNDDFSELMASGMLLAISEVEDRFYPQLMIRSGRQKATEQLFKYINSEAGIEKKKFENVNYYDVLFHEHPFMNKISFFEKNGLFVLSPSAELLRETINAMDEEEKEMSNGFQRVHATTGEDVLAHLYINFEMLPLFLKDLMVDRIAHAAGNFASWSALDLQVKAGHLILNGFATTHDSLLQELDLFEGQAPVNYTIPGIIPADVNYFRMMTFSDAPLFSQKLTDFSSTSNTSKLEKVNELYAVSLRNDFFQLSDGQIATLMMQRSNGREDAFLVAGVKGESLAENWIESLIVQIAQETNKDAEDFSQIRSIDNQNKLKVYRSPVPGLPGLLFGDLFPDVDYDYFVFYRNYLVFGKDAGALVNFVYQNILGKTLSNDTYYNQIKENVSTRSNLYIYLNPNRYFNTLTAYLREQAKEVVMKHQSAWKGIDALTFQSSRSGDMDYFRFFMNYSGEVREFVNTVWERKLDTLSNFKPAIVVNHNNLEKEIMIQDELNQLYLISNTGSILWKLQMDGEVKSDVYQIDFYNNGKLQYLFNTRDKLYLIDRNGNAVERYPVSLRAPASAGMALFDYENDGNLRIAVPGTGRDVYMYNKEGNIVPGWDFGEADFQIQHPLQHIRIGNSDYIIGNDKVRLHVLNRRGGKRVLLNQQIEHSERNPVYFDEYSVSSGPRLVGTDNQGFVYYFGFDGRVRKAFKAEVGTDHFFVLSDLNGDRQNEYIFTDGSRLMVYNEEGELLFDENYPDEIVYRPVIYEFSRADKKIGIVVPASERIYLVNNDGSLYQGFPLKGASLFSISSFPELKDRFNLIVGNKDNFLYNYSVK